MFMVDARGENSGVLKKSEGFECGQLSIPIWVSF
jgi:hypothetical protein